MKKLLLIVFVALLGTVTYAQALKIGFGTTFSIETKNTTYSSYLGQGSVSATDYLASVRVIFDIKYLIGSVGFGTKIGSEEATDHDIDDRDYIPINILLKYPFSLGVGSSFFPEVGAEYDINLATNVNFIRGNPFFYFDGNYFYLQGGFGFDIKIDNKLFIRPDLLFSYKILTTNDLNIITSEEEQGITTKITNIKVDIGVSLLFGL